MKRNRIAQISFIVVFNVIVCMMLLSLLESGTSIAGEPGADQGPIRESSADGQGAVLLSPDIVHLDDVIIDGSLCVGDDCYSGLDFGLDTIVLMENDLRIFFDDTSTGSDPDSDWWILINDSDSGSANYFAIKSELREDPYVYTTTPFKIEARASSNSLYVDADGDVGVGTDTPDVELNVVDGNQAILRLEQDASGGWGEQTWDVVGNESWFCVQDVTNDNMVFRIQPGAPEDGLCLKSDGKVGLGTWEPAYPLELETTGKDAVFAAQRTGGATATLSAGASEVQFGSVTNHPLELVVNDTPLMTLDSYGGSGVKTQYHSGITWTLAFSSTYFAISDTDGVTMPFKIEAEAPDNSLYVDSHGDVGLNTSTPYYELHIVDGDSPTVRLEQDASYGWTPQIWDLCGDESSFFIRDATLGSKLPFRIETDAPTDTVFLKSNGHVGIGTGSPGAQLHVEGSDASFRVVNTTSSTTILDLDIDGDLTLAGLLTEASDKALKENFRPVDGQQVLEGIAQLPISTWNFISDDQAIQHMGPMAQDFYAAFGLGADDRHIASLDANGVALAGVQELHQMLVEREAQIAELQQQNADLEARLAELEALVYALVEAQITPEGQ